ncbi:porin family protein [Chlorobaculum thiosulfatiphilum]|jgi:opacity protein-like surface antigen|uniref:Porin family protein n=1 Tax=Chlorobaculum thiosulfatiphilum TaxID=115852 RepID=A0A5C4S6H1_CHLTI|nr:porin family protein [Chlorobaculum thiosulfatiphilum]TNJ39026.1 porin family protein [Chlorobaculum thiosulfatiphilum]
MKQTSKMVMVAVALLAGASGTAWANGTEMPPAEPAVYTPPPAPMEAPAPPPLVMTQKTGPYISGAAGIGFPSLEVDGYDIDDALDSGLVLNGAVGYNFGSARLEGAVGYQSHDVSDADDVNISILTVMANAYYDFDTDSGIRPYIMGGAGIADVDTNQDTDSETVFAWQVGAGLGFEVADNTTLDLGYRYLKPSEIEDSIDIESHNVMLGLRYQF